MYDREYQLCTYLLLLLTCYRGLVLMCRVDNLADWIVG